MPYIHEHSCRLRKPKDFICFARKNEEQLHKGLPIDVIYGINKKGTSYIQALRYPTEAWSEQDAAEHCRDRKGEFHPALRIRLVQPTRQELPLAKDKEVKLVDELIDFGTGPEKVQVFYPKNKLISKEQRERAERDYEEATIAIPTILQNARHV